MGQECGREQRRGPWSLLESQTSSVSAAHSGDIEAPSEESSQADFRPLVAALRASSRFPAPPWAFSSLPRAPQREAHT